MKKIIFIRHGKAKRDSKSGNDFDRKLAVKGIIQANIIGHLLQEQKLDIDHIISSDACRTRETIEIITEILHFPASKIEWRSDLYLCEQQTLLNTCFNLSDNYNTIAICGHNFGLTDCMNYFIESDYELSTCGTAIIQFDCESWTEISKGMGELEWLKLPKNVID